MFIFFLFIYLAVWKHTKKIINIFQPIKWLYFYAVHKFSLKSLKCKTILHHSLNYAYDNNPRSILCYTIQKRMCKITKHFLPLRLKLGVCVASHQALDHMSDIANYPPVTASKSQLRIFVHIVHGFIVRWFDHIIALV